MVLFLYGNDIGEIQYKYREILNRFQERNKGEYTLQLFNKLPVAGEEEQVDIVGKLLDFLKSVPIFNFKKIAIITNFEQLTLGDYKRLYEFLSQTDFFQNKLEFLVIRYNGLIKVRHKKTLSEFLKHSIWQKFELPKDYKSIASKITTGFSRYGLKLEAPALSFLALHFKNTVELISKELERIIPYFIIKKVALVKREDLEKLFFRRQQGDVFSFLNSLLSRDHKTLFSTLDHLIKEDEVEIFIHHLRVAIERLILIKSMSKTSLHDICQKLKLHPYYYRKLLMISKKYSEKQLKKIYQHCLEYNLQKERGVYRNKKLGFSLFVLDELFTEKFC